MRLLRTTDLSLVDFAPDSIPRYAILSHTWGDDEVLYEDIMNGCAREKKACAKVEQACLIAQEARYKYIWIDTCCIDKKSSAELSEAINSMYQWYQKADICYAYLSDLNCDYSASFFDDLNLWRNCRWFNRGWTLQELLAPETVHFYGNTFGHDREIYYTWKCIGSIFKLTRLLSKVTGIDEDILTGSKPLASASIAKRMYWASSRQTTRPEDRAYSLMGLFSVNMAMLYGEGGEKAFLRLQEEIMKTSDDHSLFAWVDRSYVHHPPRGLLATDPSLFSHSRDMLPYQYEEFRPPFLMTNRGLQIDLYLATSDRKTYTAFLDCCNSEQWSDRPIIAVFLERIPGASNQYGRVYACDLYGVTERYGNRAQIYVRQSFEPASVDAVLPRHVLQLRDGPPQDECKILNVLVPSAEWIHQPLAVACPETDTRWLASASQCTFRITTYEDAVLAAILFELRDGQVIAILLGTAPKFKVGFQAIVPSKGRMNYGEWFETQEKRMPSLRKPGEICEILGYDIIVDVEPIECEGITHHMVDIDISRSNWP